MSAVIVPDRPPSMLVIVIDRFSDIPAVVTSLAAKRVCPSVCRRERNLARRRLGHRQDFLGEGTGLFLGPRHLRRSSIR